jgi:hypothetical protein
MYDGRVGRWMTTDPYSQYHSPYLAMGNDPISRIDPDGGTDGEYKPLPVLNLDFSSLENISDDYKWKEFDKATLLKYFPNEPIANNFFEKAFHNYMQESTFPASLTYQENDCPTCLNLEFYSTAWKKSTTPDGISTELSTNIVPGKGIVNHTGISFFEVKSTSKTSFNYRNYNNGQIGAQINYLKGGRRNSYTFVTTSDPLTTTAFRNYANTQRVVYAHYVSYYRVDQNGTVYLKWKSRGQVFGFTVDFNLIGGKLGGVPLRTP